MKLQGKRAVITGGARGIGRAIAAGYLAEGAEVFLADLDGAAAAETASALGDKAAALALVNA